MKKLYLSLALVLGLTEISQSQPWLKNIKTTEPTFKDAQEAFYEYWNPLDVRGGKYVKDNVSRKAIGWKQFKRWEWYWANRVGPQGKFPDNTMIWNEAAAAYKNSERAAAETWTSMGPSTNATGGIGRINCMAFHPTDPNIFWVGTPAGGLWKTVNGGASWSTNTDELPVLGISSIAVNPVNPSIMYVATGDGEGASSLSSFGAPNVGDTKSIGVLKSTDGGQTWNNILPVDQANGFLIRKMLIDPDYPDYLYLATNMGIYMTSDAGANWNQVQVGHFMDIEFKPGNTNVLYASKYDYNGDAQIYKSTDGGASWSLKTSFTGINRIEMAVTPVNPNVIELLAADASTNGLYGIYYSNDAGETYTKYVNGGAGTNYLGWYDNASDSDGQGNYDLVYAIDPTNWNNLYLGGVNGWKSTDGGTTWNIGNIWTSDPSYNTTGTTQIVHADKHFLTFHPLNNNILFECNDGGIYKSMDKGNTWTDISNGIVNSQMYSIATSQLMNTVVVAGLQDNGSIACENGSWFEFTGGDGMMCHADYSDSNFFYTSYAEGVLYRINATSGTTVISDNVPGNPKGSWVTPYQIHPTVSTTLFAGYDELYKSVNRGDSWVKLSNLGLGITMDYLSVAPSNPNIIYVGYKDALIKSTDGGTNFVTITGSLPVSSNYISSIKSDHQNANTLYVTFSGYTAAEKVYKTTDGGLNWTGMSSTGLPNLPVNTLEIDKFSGDIYVGTDAGVYLYNAGTSSWNLYGMGLPNVVVTDLDIQYPTGQLRAGTFGRGLWTVKSNSVLTSDKRNITQVEDYNIYPNPTSGKIRINSLNVKDNPSLIRAYNAAGKCIGEFRSGTTNETEIDLSTQPEGLYFLQLTTSKGMIVKKVVVE